MRQLTTNTSPTKHHRLWPVTLCSFLALVILLGLGAWQVERRAWKHELITRLAAAAAAEPVDLATAGANPSEFLRVRVSGHFLAGERHLFSMLSGAPGWRVISPFETTSGTVVLVDRGFAPQDLKDTVGRLTTDGDAITIEGLVRYHDDSRSTFTPDNRPDEDAWYWWDIPAMANSFRDAGVVSGDVLPFVIQKAEGSTAVAWPMPTAAVPELSDRHLGYAITWFGLAACLVVIYAVYVGRILRDRKGAGRSTR